MKDGLSVLIVEDEAIIAEDLSHRVAKLGYRVVGSVASGLEAIAAVDRAKPDVILMDILLRGQMDGIEAATIIRQVHGTPIVYVTSHADSHTVNSATITEPMGYLLKPIDDRELRVTLLMAVYRHFAENKMRQMERWMSTTLHSIGDGLIATDTKGSISYMNRRAEELTGWSASEAFGRPLEEVFNLWQPDGTQMPSLVHKVLDSGDSYNLQRRTTLQQRNGRQIYVDDCAAPIRDDHDNITGVVIIFRDGTAAIAAEDNLRASEARLRQIIDLVPAYIYAKDQDDRFLLANRVTAEALGLEPSDIEGRKLEELPISSAGLVGHLKIDPDVVASGQMKQTPEEMLPTDSGNVRILQSTKIPFVVSPHDRPAMLGVAMDITHLKQAETQRDQLLQSERDARSVAERANQAKDHFLAALSHELRTPLTPALLLLSSLQNDPELPPRIREDIELINSQIRQEARLIDDLLDVSRIVAGRMRLNRSTVDIHALLMETKRVCCNSDTVKVDLNLQARCHLVDADPVRIRQMLVNLMGNSLKFTPIGGQVTITTTDLGPKRIGIEVRDNGRGIDPDLLPRLFNAFEQGDPHTARQFGGLGLGLAIARAIVQLHGGTITAHSAGIGQGTTINLELASISEPKLATAEPKQTEALPAKSLRLLLVEDHEQTARIVMRLLKSAGHEVQVADSVTKACRLADSQEFDLVISDIGLPDGTGLEIMRHLSTRCSTPGIAVSGYGQPEDILRSLQAGFASHLVKPVDGQVLLETLQAVVNQAAGIASAGPSEGVMDQDPVNT